MSTLYVAAVAAIKKTLTGIAPGGIAEGSVESTLRVVMLIVFATATPMVVWLVYAAKVGTRIFGCTGAADLPAGEMVAATIAFNAWAFAFPQNPYRVFGWYWPAIAGLVVLVTSSLLGLITPLVVDPFPAR